MNEALRKLEALLSNAAAVPKRYAPNSRYYGLSILVHTQPDGRAVPYLARRFVAAADARAPALAHLVVQGERLDLLAARYLGDPEQWWKIADANPTLRPAELTEAAGTAVRIPAPGVYTGRP